MRRHNHGFASTAVYICCVLLCTQAHARVSFRTKRVFLQKELPLTIVVTTPTGLAGNGTTPTSLFGRQALTVVFSRPVIALGSDFGKASAVQKLPFSLTCDVPGKSRWVTTTIARFDPDVDWPSDLDCELVWARNLTTYDGAPLVLGDVSGRRRLSTFPQSMWVSEVTSERASNLTDGMWTSYLDGRYEVPPDGKVLVSFNYPVNLQMLQSALQMVQGDGSSGPQVPVEVSPCQSAAWWLYTPISTSSSSSSSSSSGLSLDVNTTCAQIAPKSALNVATSYSLVLPTGARYHALAGPVQKAVTATVTGLRPFQLRFIDYLNNNVDTGTRYRRLDLGLPHGLSSDTTPAAFAARVSLCQLGKDTCTATPFSVSLVSRGMARLDVPSLAPRLQYRISIAADPEVKDGFGQSLLASDLTFWAGRVYNAFAAPGCPSSVAALEAGADALPAWPFVTRGLGSSADGTGDLPDSVFAWELDLGSDRVQKLVAKTVQPGMFYGTDLSWYGAPNATLRVPSEPLSTEPNAPGWMELRMPLSDGVNPSRARLVAYASVGNPQSPRYAQLVLNTTLSLNIIQAGQQLTAWVLDSAPGAAGPVAGASVSVVASGWTQDTPEIIASCVTDADGMCTMTYNKDNDWTLTAFAAANGQFAVLHHAGVARAATSPANYVASLVADRLVVVPGDTVKITGFVQRATATGLQLPPAGYAALTVTSGWKSSAATPATGGPLVMPAGRNLLESSGGGVEIAGSTAYSTAYSSSSESVSAMPYDPATTSRKLVVSRATAIGPVQTTASATSVAPATFPVKIDGSTGTFHVEVRVPDDARLQQYTLQLLVPEPGKPAPDPNGPAPLAGSSEMASWPPVSGTSITITVADPRPPTADLKLVAPAWVYPTGRVRFNATAVSYIGAAVGGAALTVTWQSANASGVIALTTDDSGLAAGQIDLGALPPANRSTPYDTLSIHVEWIGPTRERITRSATVAIADGPARLTVSLSLTPSAPGTAFAVSATLTSNTDGSPLPGILVTATLRPAPNDISAGAQCANVSSCALTSGDSFSPLCQLALPCVGHFQLEACADVPEGGATTPTATTRVCAQLALGRNASEWSVRPLTGHPDPELFTDKTSYSVGDTVRLQLQNPWPGARLLVQWGNEFRSRTKVLSTLPSGLVEASIGPLGDEAVGGVTIVAVLDVPRLAADQLPPLPPPSQLAVSRLFDPLAPHSHILTASLDVRPYNTLDVSVDVAGSSGSSSWTIRDVNGDDVVAVEPGAEAEVTVTVQSATSASAAAAPAGAGVEVTLYAVDQAFLDLLPYDLPQPQQEMVLRLAANIQAYDVSAYWIAPGAVRAVYDKLMARLTGQDPWLPADTSLQSRFVSAVDVNDTTYLAGYSTMITQGTPMPRGRLWYPVAGGVAMGGSLALPGFTLEKGEAVSASVSSSATLPASDSSSSGSNGSGSSSGSSSSSSVSVRSTSDFVVTPLFTSATTDSAGKATFSFTGPQNLGTFVLRAFAASGVSAQYGAGESKVAVRRRLSLTPSVPRFVRVGDTFQAGVVVTVGSVPATVTVTLQLAASASSAVPLTLTGAATKTVAFPSGGDLQREVRFSFSAGAIGSANLTFTAADVQQGGAQDALQLEIPVMGQQGDVWVATSFALTATPASSNSSLVQWQEGIDLPAAVHGSGGLNLTAGVGYFPAIAASYDSLMQSEADRTYASAVSAVQWATLPAVLSYYGQPISGAQSNATAGAFTDLVELTDPSLGLLWSDPNRWYGWRATRTDIYLNTWGLFLAGLHGPALRAASSGSSSLPPSLAPFATSWASLESVQLPLWRAAVARQLVQDAIDSRNRPYFPGPYEDWYTLAWVRLVLGGGWQPADASAQIRDDLSLATLVAKTQQDTARQTRTVVALVLQAMGRSNPNPQYVSNVVSDITSALRVQGRTAYVASSPGAAAASSLEDQALSLLLLLRAGVTHQLLPKLAAYVANPAQITSFGVFTSCPAGQDQGLVVAALTEYDRTRGSSKPDVELLADVNGLAVLEASFQPGGSTLPVSNTTVWEDLPQPAQGELSKLSFEVTGSGEVTVAASLHFVPAALLSFPSYRGLFVEAALQLVDPATGQPMGQRVTAVPLGSLVALTVQLTSPDDLGPVTLSIMMPGGLEPLDPNLASASGLGTSCGDNWVNNWSSFRWWWWWPTCPSQETRPSVVTFSYLGLRAGTSSVTVTAVAATAGTFVLPPVRASADSQPELMGMTAAGSFTVCDNCSKPTFAGPLAAPIACQNDCSGNGLCNLKTGQCRCNAGYTRADCSRLILA